MQEHLHHSSAGQDKEKSGKKDELSSGPESSERTGPSTRDQFRHLREELESSPRSINTPLQSREQLHRQQKRGYGEVLLLNGIPQKVIGKEVTVSIRPVTGDSNQPLKVIPGKPYFVFEERQGELLIGDEQYLEKSLALGWVPANQVERWNLRTVILDENEQPVSYVQSESNGETTLISAKTGELHKVSTATIQGKRASSYNEKEFYKSGTYLLALIAKIESGTRIKPDQLARQLSLFLNLNQHDTLDKSKLEKIFTNYQQGKESKFLRGERLRQELRQMKEELLDRSVKLLEMGIDSEGVVFIQE